jgi:hypothetical protein
MSSKKFLLIHFRPLTLLLLLVLLCVASAAKAQSGRRIPKSPPKPPETTQPKETPPETPKPSQNKEPLVPILVVYQLQTVFNSNIYTDYVTQACLDRLQKSLAAAPQFGKSMNRKEASDAAKASTDTYVLWFQLEADSSDAEFGGMNRNNAQSFYVNFVLYTPATGKNQAQGRIYQDRRGIGPTSIPQNNMTVEYYLKRAGRDLADRILNTLNLPLPPDKY